MVPFFCALSWRCLVPPAILLHVSPTFALKTVSCEVLGFGIVPTCTFAFLVSAFCPFRLRCFHLSCFCLCPAFLVALASLIFSSYTQHQEIHGYSITSGRIRLCSAAIEQLALEVVPTKV